ncbi:hypothetical protein ZWY2020_029491 [Hordeum vulgare]|nr:hypothetical protein ZWY2020_029491 [Hordeum vulgare]
MEPRPSLVKIRKLVAPGTTSIEAEHQIEAMPASDYWAGNGYFLMPPGSIRDEDLHKDEMGKSNSIISEKEIEHLCKQMEEMTTIMRHRIKPSAPLSSSNETEDEDKAQPVIDSIIKELADLQGSMSKLKSQLKPFWHKCPYEEDYVAPEERRIPRRRQGWKWRTSRCSLIPTVEALNLELDTLDTQVNIANTTLVSPMHFTLHAQTDSIRLYYSRTTLQIFSFKIANISLDLEWPLLHWPLKVYSVVVARDNVDNKCNCVMMVLAGLLSVLDWPSRAISADRPLEFEVQLKLKGDATESEDSVLINNTGHYNGYDTHNGLYTFTIENCLCTTELSLQKLYRGTVKPLSCVSALPCHSTQVVLLDSRDCAGGKMPIGEEDGYLDLSRHVVSVELRTVVKILKTYSPGDSVQAPVMIRPQYCGISKHKCDINGTKLKITIAWSPIVSSAGTKIVAV